MKDAINKRNNLLNEKLMRKWGFKDKDMLQENAGGADIILEEETPVYGRDDAQWEELEASLHVDDDSTGDQLKDAIKAAKRVSGWVKRGAAEPEEAMAIVDLGREAHARLKKRQGEE